MFISWLAKLNTGMKLFQFKERKSDFQKGCFNNAKIRGCNQFSSVIYKKVGVGMFLSEVRIILLFSMKR